MVLKVCVDYYKGLEKNPEQSQETRTYILQGKIETERKNSNPVLANQALEKALELAEFTEVRYDWAEANQSYANLLFQTGHVVQAQEKLHVALQAYKAIGISKRECR